MKKLFVLIYLAGVLMASALPKFYSEKLKNDMEIVVIPLNNNTGVISIDLFYKAGSRNEIMGKSGLAHMLEHMNFKSTDKLKAGEFDEIIKSFGGINNASTSFDYTHYYVKTSKDNLEKPLELFSQMMRGLKLDDSEFQPERDVVLEERRWRTDNNPTGMLYFKLFNTAYDYHPYHWTPIGFVDDIKSWKVEDLKEYYETYYQPKNSVLVVSGDIQKPIVVEYAKKYFEDLKNTKEIPTVHTKEPEQKGKKRQEIIFDTEIEILGMSWHIPNYESDDIVPLTAASELLTQGASSRLMKLLVDEKNMVNQIYAYVMDQKDPGVFLIIAVCNVGIKAEKVEKEILKELENLKNSKISNDEIEKIKIGTKSDFIFSLEDSSSISNLFGSYFARGNIKPLLEYEEKIEKLDVNEIIRVVKKYLKPSNSTTVILRKGIEE